MLKPDSGSNVLPNPGSAGTLPRRQAHTAHALVLQSCSAVCPHMVGGYVFVRVM